MPKAFRRPGGGISISQVRGANRLDRLNSIANPVLGRATVSSCHNQSSYQSNAEGDVIICDETEGEEWQTSEGRSRKFTSFNNLNYIEECSEKEEGGNEEKSLSDNYSVQKTDEKQNSGKTSKTEYAKVESQVAHDNDRSMFSLSKSEHKNEKTRTNESLISNQVEVSLAVSQQSATRGHPTDDLGYPETEITEGKSDNQRGIEAESDPHNQRVSMSLNDEPEDYYDEHRMNEEEKLRINFEKRQALV